MWMIYREDVILNKFLKIGLLIMAASLLSGCNKAQEKVTDSPSATNEPTEIVEQDVTLTPTLFVSEDVPQGDLAQDIVIAIDPGHGGDFSGASYSGRIEKKLTLQVAGYVKDYLESNYTGVKIVLTRESDTALAGAVKDDLEQRAIIAKDANADALVSIHFNASDDHSQNGCMVLVSHRDNVSEVSKSLAESILKELNSLGLKNHGTVTRNSNDMFDDSGNPLDYYAVNRHCANRDIPGIIVEHCFMDNEKDSAYIDSDEDLKVLAKADAVGIANYFGLIPNK